MLTKLIFTTFLLALLIGGGVGLKNAYKSKKQNQVLDENTQAKKDTLKWYADKAKKEGENTIVIPAPLVEHLGAGDDPEYVLSNYSAVVAQLVESRAVIVDNDKAIITWYKFKTLENITQRPAVPNLPLPTIDPPQDLLPLNEGEFLIATYGGNINIDGANVTMLNSELPPFHENERYFLFISKLSSGIANLWAGPTGVFHVKSDDSIEPIDRKGHPMKDILRTRFGNSVRKLKEDLSEK